MSDRHMSSSAAWVVLVVVCSAAGLAWWLSGRAGQGTSPTTRPVATVTRTVTAAPSVPAPTTRTPWEGRVVHVADGDTLDVEAPAGRVRVRLLDVDTPETAHGAPAQCGAQASKAALAALLLGRTVRVVPDQVGDVTDRFGRALVTSAKRARSGNWAACATQGR